MAEVNSYFVVGIKPKNIDIQVENEHRMGGVDQTLSLACQDPKALWDLAKEIQTAAKKVEAMT